MLVMKVMMIIDDDDDDDDGGYYGDYFSGYSTAATATADDDDVDDGLGLVAPQLGTVFILPIFPAPNDHHVAKNTILSHIYKQLSAFISHSVITRHTHQDVSSAIPAVVQQHCCSTAAAVGAPPPSPILQHRHATRRIAPPELTLFPEWSDTRPTGRSLGVFAPAPSPTLPRGSSCATQ